MFTKKLNSIVVFGLLLSISILFKGNFSKRQVNTPVVYAFPSLKITDYHDHWLKIPFTADYFVGYKEAVASRESKGKYNTVNAQGYIGKYQFGDEALQTVGITNRRRFLRNPKLQEKAFVALISINKWELQNEISQFEGKIVKGVRITESGLLAGAHLVGVNAVKRFLYSDSKGNNNRALKRYIKNFGNYDVSGIPANKNAKVI